jgi:hypothetical protein
VLYGGNKQPSQDALFAALVVANVGRWTEARVLDRMLVLPRQFLGTTSFARPRIRLHGPLWAPSRLGAVAERGQWRTWAGSLHHGVAARACRMRGDGAIIAGAQAMPQAAHM